MNSPARRHLDSNEDATASDAAYCAHETRGRRSTQLAEAARVWRGTPSLTLFGVAPLWSSAPKGRCHASSGQRPGLADCREYQALKERHDSFDGLSAAPSGL